MEKEGKTLSFFQRVRSEMRQGPEANKGGKGFALCYFTSVVCTAPLVFIHEIIPTEFSEYSDWTRYWLNVLVVFVAIQAYANYILVRVTSTHVIGTRDRPNNEKTLWENDRPADVRMHPGYCEKCRLLAPEGSKTHHCTVCNRCILRRDHHCFLVSTCIGYYNQRFFAVFAFYVGLGSTVGLFYLYRHLCLLASDREIVSWTDYILPLTLWKVYAGHFSIIEFLMVFYCYTFWWTAILGAGFFMMQMCIIYSGLTNNDFKKNKPMRPNTTVAENFREIFGPFWFLNFIIPAHVAFRQKEFPQPHLVDIYEDFSDVSTV